MRHDLSNRLDRRMDRLEAGQNKILGILAKIVDILAEMKDEMATSDDVQELRVAMHARMDGVSAILDKFPRS